MVSLSLKNCSPKKGTKPFTYDEAIKYLDYIGEGWQVSNDGMKIYKVFRFDDFAGALNFVDEVGSIAEEEDHHPDIYLSYGRVDVTLSTHSIKGLSENDFIVAAKIENLRL